MAAPADMTYLGTARLKEGVTIMASDGKTYDHRTVFEAYEWVNGLVTLSLGRAHIGTASRENIDITPPPPPRLSPPVAEPNPGSSCCIIA